jgi:hypothetical protein
MMHGLAKGKEIIFNSTSKGSKKGKLIRKWRV